MNEAFLGLQPGDHLLYSPTGFFGLLIAVKSWHKIAHIEVYVGNGSSIASRDGVGVGLYPFREDDLAYILRPNQPIDLEKGLAWFRTVQGQGYDWLGLLRFAWRSEYVPEKAHENKQFCSEFVTRFDRQMGFDPFPREDADAIAPFQFESNPFFSLVKAL
jgi:hypothetical protein